MPVGQPKFDIKTSNLEQDLSPEFLQQQIRLPREKWDPKFRVLIDEKGRENQRGRDTFPDDIKRKSEKEISTEASREYTFKKYLEALRLKERDLDGRRIIDLGCGVEAQFIRYCIEKSITNEAYGIDRNLNKALLSEFGNNLFRANFKDKLPVTEADIITSVGAVDLVMWDDKEAAKFRKILENCLASMSKSGEIRMAYIQEPSHATPLPALEVSRRNWDKFLVEITELYNLECKIEPSNVIVVGNDNDICLGSVLIIKKKEKTE